MPSEFDRRVISPTILAFIRACQERVPCHLGGGAALAGAYLRHRVTGDVDLFCHQADEMRTAEQLQRFRDELAERLRRIAAPS